MGKLHDLAASEPAKKVYSLWDEFKNFAFKGNVIDLAVAVVIGNAFTAIITSLVKDVIMPTVALILPTTYPYMDWKLTVGDKSIPFGKFLGEVVNFLLIAGFMFLFIVKFLGWLIRTRKEEKQDPPAPSKEEVLLTEIRDALNRMAPPLPAPATQPTSIVETNKPGGA
jgi:large conductance mechanosensitive channel